MMSLKRRVARDRGASGAGDAPSEQKVVSKANHTGPEPMARWQEPQVLWQNLGSWQASSVLLGSSQIGSLA